MQGAGDSKMNKKQKKNLIRIIIAAVMTILLHFLPVEGIPRFILYMITYLIIGYDILIKAFQGIKTASRWMKTC